MAEAVEHISNHDHMWPTGDVFEWDGEGVPATICDYPVAPPQAVTK